MRYARSTSATVSTCLSLLLLAALAIAPGNADECVARAALVDKYRRWSAAIERRDLPAFWRLLGDDTEYLCFTYRDERGEVVSRGDWLHGWRDNFATVSEYRPVEFVVERFVLDEDQAEIEIRRRIFYKLAPSGEESFQESRTRDLWLRSGAAWRLVRQEAMGYPIEGTVESRSIADDGALIDATPATVDISVKAIARRWQNGERATPIIETIAGDEATKLVTFVWRGDDATSAVALHGGLPSDRTKSLVRVGATGLWMRQERLPADSRFVYFLEETRPMRRRIAGGSAVETVLVAASHVDPNNPRHFNGGSVVELAQAPRGEASEQVTRVSHGLIERHSIASRFFNEERRFTVYTPASEHVESKPRGLLVLFDGDDYQRLIPTPAILDNLIAENKIPPLVAVFIDNRTNRTRDLHCSAKFADFVCLELVPWVRQRYQLSNDPRRAVVGGLSLGGLMAAYCGLRHPETFGNVLSQSGAFWRNDPQRDGSEGGWLARQFASEPKRPLRFYLEVGRLEAMSMLEHNRRMRDILAAKGYQAAYREFNGGHDYLSWRVNLADAVTALVGDDKDSK